MACELGPLLFLFVTIAVFYGNQAVYKKHQRIWLIPAIPTSILLAHRSGRSYFIQLSALLQGYSVAGLASWPCNRSVRFADLSEPPDHPEILDGLGCRQLGQHRGIGRGNPANRQGAELG